MLDSSGFNDLRNYIKRRVSYARYRVGSTWYTTTLSNCEVLANGTVRAQININNGGTAITVNRVELRNSDQELWAHTDCSITISANQGGVLFWFDFTITEVTS
mgnify:CR=1 FL=1